MAEKKPRPVGFPTATKPPPYSVEASGYTKVEGETIPRRHPDAKDALIVRPEPSVSTVYDILKRSKEKYGDRPAVGERRMIKIHSEVKIIPNDTDQPTVKTWKYYELGPYWYLSFNEYVDTARDLGAGLKKLGMSAGDRLHIFAGTSQYWLLMAHAASTQSLPIVTSYDSLGEAGLQHSLCQARSKAIFFETGALWKLTNILKQATDVKILIHNDNDARLDPDVLENFLKEHPHLMLIGFRELKALGKAHPVQDVPPSPDDLCCIMYTSGSTGPPKGVLLKHKNVVAAIAGADVIIGPYMSPGERMLAYLPLAHSLEFTFENACFYWGGTLGYADPKTLSNTSVRDCKGDMREFSPSIMVGVPAVWETVKKGILSRVNSNIAVRNVFLAAMSLKSLLVSTGLPGVAMLDALVFSKFKDATGGNLQVVMSGGGPLAKDTQHFISMAICPVVIGYGLTETCGMGTLNDPGAWTTESLGSIPACIELKLVDCPELGYITSRPNDLPSQGELWIRGGSVTDGYLGDLVNHEDFEDGWFKTGDVAEFDRKGGMRIIDRKKNLVKTLNGEYIALEKLESIYRTNFLVSNICVYASPTKSKPIAIIVPIESALTSFASKNGINGSYSELIQDQKLSKIVLKEMQKSGRDGALSGLEIIDGIVLVGEEWNPMNGYTTSAQKINRKGILAKYQKEVDQVYGDL